MIDPNDLIREAQCAFWQKVRELVPGAKNEGLETTDLWMFNKATAETVKKWLEANAPDLPTFEKFLDTVTTKRSENYFDVERCTYDYGGLGEIQNHGPRYSLVLGVAKYRSDDLRELELKLYDYLYKGVR